MMLGENKEALNNAALQISFGEVIVDDKKFAENFNLVLINLINCSQTKFVAIILVLLVFFLCDFSLDRFFVWRFWLFVLKNGINR